MPISLVGAVGRQFVPSVVQSEGLFVAVEDFEHPQPLPSTLLGVAVWVKPLKNAGNRKLKDTNKMSPQRFISRPHYFNPLRIIGAG